MLDGDSEKVLQIHKDYHNAGLDPADVAMLDYVNKVTLESHNMDERDVQTLRDHGFSDLEILEITLIAAQRNFITRVANALGVPIEPPQATLEKEFIDPLKVGKPW